MTLDEILVSLKANHSETNELTTRIAEGTKKVLELRDALRHYQAYRPDSMRIRLIRIDLDVARTELSNLVALAEAAVIKTDILAQAIPDAANAQHLALIVAPYLAN
jgi:hypothetical protein